MKLVLDAEELEHEKWAGGLEVAIKGYAGDNGVQRKPGHVQADGGAMKTYLLDTLTFAVVVLVLYHILLGMFLLGY